MDYFSNSCLSFLLLALSFQTYMACNPSDLLALNGFSNCLTSKIDGWNSTASDCCTWTGVTCDNSTYLSKRVIGLELGNKRLTGMICESLAGLDQLRILNLSHNLLHGTLPAKVFGLQNLEVLDLSNNDFVDSIPPIGKMSSIRYVDLSKNYFKGSINATLCEISPHIQVLNLASNNFSGEVSRSFGQCTSLQHLFLNSNSLSGNFPESLLQLQNLHVLHLEDNIFSGQLNAELGNLSNLVELDISSNRFSGNLPNVFGKLGKLEHFSANTNMFSGYLPESLVNSPSLITLDVDNNTLNGAININCSAMIHLVSLNLGSNNFHGPIPESISYCQSLNILNLSKNKLGGEIPYNFKNLQALTSLSLSKNNLANISGALGILQHCKNLTTLILSMNFQDEQIPGDVNLQFKNLKALAIPNCQLRGLIPLWLNGCKKLQLLDMSWNLLGGSIPLWIGNFNSLFYLDLSNNSFTGGIPMSLTGLQTLTDRNISTDGNAPCVPLYKTRVPSGSLQYNKIGSLPPTLDLSCNKLTGPIWPSFGNLKRLHVLKLNKNDLSGPIPDSLSGMSSLETLDLSYNKLSGEIPTSLVKLNFLSKFSVAYNQLCGEIPTGGQFLTFPNSSFMGNKGLGARDFAFCQLVDSPREQMTIIGLPFAVGSATGFVLTVNFFLQVWVGVPKARKKMKPINK
ncbi:hypothetical protein P3X46_013505 [Hevea brasiliensis]|uniref:Leucine-rich repeat-containing N-terminal plant-type domain-containing protein n=2 Tax=Hevea brasiliensis TaxID=3981 RepID=A0ABQ9M7N6_HEVBR|nr:hypothetical protein P3X46_013505 [Hevea brasiliensis]